MTAGKEQLKIYSIELDERDVVAATSLFSHDDADIKCRSEIEEVMEMCFVDEETAIELLAEEFSTCHLSDPDNMLFSQNFAALDSIEQAEITWEIQRLNLECAKKLGFRSVQLTDEQGASWLVSMRGRESELSDCTDG